MKARLEEFVFIETTRGAGVINDPIRTHREFHDMEGGGLVGSYDADAPEYVKGRAGEAGHWVLRKDQVYRVLVPKSFPNGDNQLRQDLAPRMVTGEHLGEMLAELAHLRTRCAALIIEREVHQEQIKKQSAALERFHGRLAGKTRKSRSAA